MLFILETYESYRPYFAAGVMGAIMTWVLILKGRCWADWHLRTARVLAWIWIPLIAIGTVLGILMLSARHAAVNAKSAQAFRQNRARSGVAA